MIMKHSIAVYLISLINCPISHIQMNCCGTIYMQEKVFSRENEKLNKVELIRFSLVVNGPSNKTYCKKKTSI